MDIIPIIIQLYLEVCSRKEYGKGRWIKQKTGLARGSKKG